MGQVRVLRMFGGNRGCCATQLLLKTDSIGAASRTCGVIRPAVTRPGSDVGPPMPVPEGTAKGDRRPPERVDTL